MVTKGYRKGVYDRVTEGTWEKGWIGNRGVEVAHSASVATGRLRQMNLGAGQKRAAVPTRVRRRGLPWLTQPRRGQARLAGEGDAARAKPWCSSTGPSARGRPRMILSNEPKNAKWPRDWRTRFLGEPNS